MPRKKKETLPADWPPSMTEDALREFVLGYVDGRLFTSAHIPANQQERMLQSVFVPILFGVFNDVSPAQLKNVGVIWEWMKEAGSRSINGYPMFYSARTMNKADWKKAVKAIELEQERRKTIPV